jgi:ABC-2 type transport system permease protein
VAIIFSLLGLLVALWAESFEQLQVLNIFLITPLTYLGGIFYSVLMLPGIAQTATYFNPFFYFVNGIRGAMVGVNEANVLIGYAVLGGLVLFLSTFVVYLFKIGWKLRA